MIPLSWKIYAAAGALAVLLAAGWAFVRHEREIGARDAEIRQLTTEVQTLRQRRDTLTTRYVHDTVMVARWRTRYTAIRDTVNIHDTVEVRAALVAADTTIRACTTALSRCDSIRHVNDNLTAALDSVNHRLAGERAGFWSRFGVWLGPALAVDRGGRVGAGVAAGFGVKVWP